MFSGGREPIVYTTCGLINVVAIAQWMNFYWKDKKGTWEPHLAQMRSDWPDFYTLSSKQTTPFLDSAVGSGHTTGQ